MKHIYLLIIMFGVCFCAFTEPFIHPFHKYSLDKLQYRKLSVYKQNSLGIKLESLVDGVLEKPISSTFTSTGNLLHTKNMPSLSYERNILNSRYNISKLGLTEVEDQKHFRLDVQVSLGISLGDFIIDHPLIGSNSFYSMNMWFFNFFVGVSNEIRIYNNTTGKHSKNHTSIRPYVGLVVGAIRQELLVQRLGFGPLRYPRYNSMIGLEAGVLGYHVGWSVTFQAQNLDFNRGFYNLGFKVFADYDVAQLGATFGTLWGITRSNHPLNNIFDLTFNIPQWSLIYLGITGGFRIITRGERSFGKHSK